MLWYHNEIGKDVTVS